MNDMILRAVILLAVLAILLHLGLILYATLCRQSNWWESPWLKRIETARWTLAWIISGLFLLALLTSCTCQCRPTIPPDRLLHPIQTRTLDSVLDSGIGINCEWSY